MPSSLPAAPQHPAHHRWWILLTVGVGTFMSALDGSAVSSVLPVIMRDLQGNVASIEWVITIYLLIVSALLLGFGRLGDVYGQRRFYLAGFFIFVGSSTLCGLARSPGGLIAARGVQAVGAALLFSSAPAILTKTFPAEQRGRALGLLATMTYMGLSVGPALGGWLTEGIGWRSVFFLNIPFGVAALCLAARFVARARPAAVSTRFDIPGAVAFGAGLTALLLVLNRAHQWGWDSTATLGLLGAAASLLCLFAWIERRAEAPMLDLSLFRNRTFAAATLSGCLNYIAIFTGIFLMPFYLIQGCGLSPARAGGFLTVQPIVMAAVAPLSGLLSDRIGARLLSTIGMALLSVGLFFLSRLGPEGTHGPVILGLALAGLGTGMFISPNSSALMGAAPRARQGIAAGILAEARNVGMVLGVGMAGAIFTTWTARGATLFGAVHAGLRAGALVALAGALVSAARGRVGTRTELSR